MTILHTMSGSPDATMHEFEMSTPLGPVKASWQRNGDNIMVRYGEHQKPAQASDHDTVNDFVAKDIVRGWIAEEARDV